MTEDALHTLVLVARGNPIVMEKVREVEAAYRVLAQIVADLAAEDVLSAVGDVDGGWYVICNWCAAYLDPGDGGWSRDAMRVAEEAIVHDRDCLGWRARRWVADREPTP